VTQEEADVELIPQRAMRVVGHGLEAQQRERLLLARLQFRMRVGLRAAEHRERDAVQVLEQLALPGVPHLRAGAADIGNGQQIERGQVAFVADDRGEALDHFRVARVLLLRDLAHRQVMLDQPYDQRRIVAADAVFAAEASRVGHAERRVIAAAALRDVVEQRRDVEHPRALEIADQLAAERIFVRMLGHREAADVAQHHEDVLVDRVHVIQVVLHLADDAAKIQQVAAEHAGLVHQPQRMRDAFGLLQDLHERAAVLRIAPPRVVHDFARVVQRAQRAGRQALHAARRLVQQERFEDRVGWRSNTPSSTISSMPCFSTKRSLTARA
jgi:hypothetical protein